MLYSKKKIIHGLIKIMIASAASVTLFLGHFSSPLDLLCDV